MLFRRRYCALPCASVVTLFHCDSLFRREREHFLEQVERELRRIRVQRAIVDALLERQRADVGLRLLRRDVLSVTVRRSAQSVDDQVKLVHVITAGEHGLAAEDLTENATDGPHCIGFKAQPSRLESTHMR